MATKTEIRRSPVVAAMLYGTPIGLLGGLIGLGGSELRLLVLDGVFGYGSRRAVALNLAISLGRPSSTSSSPSLCSQRSPGRY